MRRSDRIIRDLDFVVAAGFKEVALTGVHLGSYGRDLSPSVTLVDLLHGISSGRGDAVRFRVSSLEPMDCSTEVVSLMAERPAFAAHFHLPLQHASDRLLAAMRQTVYAVRLRRPSSRTSGVGCRTPQSVPT